VAGASVDIDIDIDIGIGIGIGIGMAVFNSVLANLSRKFCSIYRTKTINFVCIPTF
jgi:hypothetical protein